MTKILMFENPQDFLQAMEDLQDQYNKHLESQNQTKKGELNNE